LAKPAYTLRLSAEIWAQIDDLKGYFGDDRPEICTYIFRRWFSENQQTIADQKAAIDKLPKPPE